MWKFQTTQHMIFKRRCPMYFTMAINFFCTIDTFTFNNDTMFIFYFLKILPASSCPFSLLSFLRSNRQRLLCRCSRDGRGASTTTLQLLALALPLVFSIYIMSNRVIKFNLYTYIDRQIMMFTKMLNRLTKYLP